MNERIRELIKQHGLNITIDGLGYGEGNVEGLAELIVKECIDVVLDSDPSPKMIAHEPYRTIMNNIQEHFGFEE